MTEPEASADLAARPFDELVAELQRIVQALEAGNLPLEESIARYREALRLHAAAELRLREARKLGFSRAIVPAKARGKGPAPDGIRLREVSRLAELVDLLGT